MDERIHAFFKKEKIEYFKALSYADCKVTSERIMAREAFIPRSVIVFLIPYYVSCGENLSAYATSLDYHLYVKDVTERLAKLVLEIFPIAAARATVTIHR